MFFAPLFLGSCSMASSRCISLTVSVAMSRACSIASFSMLLACSLSSMLSLVEWSLFPAATFCSSCCFMPFRSTFMLCIMLHAAPLLWRSMASSRCSGMTFGLASRAASSLLNVSTSSTSSENLFVMFCSFGLRSGMDIPLSVRLLFGRYKKYANMVCVSFPMAVVWLVLCPCRVSC